MKFKIHNNSIPEKGEGVFKNKWVIDATLYGLPTKVILQEKNCRDKKHREDCIAILRRSGGKVKWFTSGLLILFTGEKEYVNGVASTLKLI